MIENTHSQRPQIEQSLFSNQLPAFAHNQDVYFSFVYNSLASEVPMDSIIYFNYSSIIDKSSGYHKQSLPKNIYMINRFTLSFKNRLAKMLFSL